MVLSSYNLRLPLHFRGAFMRRAFLLTIDFSLVAASTVLASVLRHDFDFALDQLPPLSPYLLFTLCVAAVVLPLFGTGRPVWRLTTLRDYLHLSAATFLVVTGGVVLGFAYNRLDGIPRSVPVLQALVMLFALVGVRVLLRLRHAARQRPQPLHPIAVDAAERTVLIIGLSRLTEAYLLSIKEFGGGRVRVAGLLGRREADIGRIVLEQPVLGLPEQLAKVLQDLELRGVSIDAIVVATHLSKLSAGARQALLDVEQAGLSPVIYLAETFGLEAHLPRDAEASTAVRQISSAFTLDNAQLAALAARPYWRLKRSLDVVVALVGLIACAPLMALTTLLVALDVGSPLVFAQQRPGLGGRPFRLYKFRTMGASHDADGHRIPDGERLSAIGRFLRRIRLDELPQLYHVLTGDMSLIGPRPLLPVDQSPDFALRLLVRPGITGWAQVIGGRDISPLDKAALDVWYVQNAGLRLDLEVLLRTVTLLLFGERISRSAIESAWRDLALSGISRVDRIDMMTWPSAEKGNRAA